MAKTRYERLPKKDRDYVASFVEARPELNVPMPDRFESTRAILLDNWRGLRTRPPRDGYAVNSVASLFASSLHLLAGELMQRLLAHRLQNDDCVTAADELHLVSRLLFVANLAKTPEYSGTDCQHVFDVLTSLAANDTEVLPVYCERYNYVAKDGHPFTKLICNAVMTLLRGEADEGVTEKLLSRKGTGHDRAMELALAAIAQLRGDDVTLQIDSMLKGHRRKSADEGLLRFFSLFAHGLFRLATLHFKANGIAVPSEPTHPLWDADFHVVVATRPFANTSGLTSIICPQLTEWVESLPVSVDREQFATALAPAPT